MCEAGVDAATHAVTGSYRLRKCGLCRFAKRALLVRAWSADVWVVFVCERCDTAL